MQPPTVIELGKREAGQTVAAVLKARLGLTWSQAKRLVERHQVRYAGQMIGDPVHRVKAGKKITVAAGAIETKSEKAPAPPRKKPPAKPSAKSAIRNPRSPFVPIVLYADDALVVTDKPAGLTTMRHAVEAAEFGERGQRFLPKTLADLLPALIGEPGRPLHAVHRLDRDTSGVVVFARTPAAAKILAAQFKIHSTLRRYLALVRGKPKSGRIESVLVRDRGDGRRGSSTDPMIADGKRAVTHVKVIEQFDRFALVECQLETGRTHQVRIHLGEAGTPLCGERVYDRPLNGKLRHDESGATRPMLHAATLAFDHPVIRDRMTFEVQPPADFIRLRDSLQK